MTTLFDAGLDVARELMPVREGVSDAAGSTTTLVDSTLNLNNENQFNNGIIWILSGTLANTIARISSFAKATGTITFTPAAASPPGSAAAYAIAPHEIELHEIKAALNLAARRYKIIKIDESLTTVANQSEYTLPAGVSDVYKVEVKLTSSAPNQWQENRQWREMNGKIYFANRSEYATAGYTIRLYYMGRQAYLDEWTDTLDPAVGDAIIKWRAVLHIAEQRLQPDPSSPRWTNMVRQAQYELDMAIRANPLPDPEPVQIFTGFGTWMDLDRRVDGE